MMNLPTKTLLAAPLLLLSGCILPPRSEAMGSSQGPVHKTPKKAAPIERWLLLEQGMAGVAADTKGSKMTMAIGDGPKGREKALLLDYNMQPGGWVSFWHTVTNVDLSKADGIRFMARAEPPSAVQLSMTDNNTVSYIAQFQAAPQWSEVRVPLAALIKNPNYQPPNSIQGKPADWSHAKSLNFDARSDGQGKIWIGPVSVDAAE
jgi:Carbohydrate binding domain (family 11)